MTSRTLIFGIQYDIRDMPRAVEQINGDLLVPREGREMLEAALLKAEDALQPDNKAELEALAAARRMLGIQKPDREKERLHRHLLTMRSI